MSGLRLWGGTFLEKWWELFFFSSPNCVCVCLSLMRAKPVHTFRLCVCVCAYVCTPLLPCWQCVGDGWQLCVLPVMSQTQTHTHTHTNTHRRTHTVIWLAVWIASFFYTDITGWQCSLMEHANAVSHSLFLCIFPLIWTYPPPSVLICC